MNSTKRLIFLSVLVVLVGIALIAIGKLTSPGDKTRTSENVAGEWVELKTAFDAEFHTRPDGYKGLCKHYGFEFPVAPLQMDPGLMYNAISTKSVDIIDGFATDGRIQAYNLAILEDDKGFFPPYYAAPLIRKETLARFPEIGEVVRIMAGKITDEAMQKMNFEVDEKGRKVTEVVREYLALQGLLPSDALPGKGSKGSVTIAGKHFTEQEILGEMTASLIECKTDVAVIRKLNLGGTMICFNALKSGDIDLYPEYTGTGLVNVLKREVVNDPQRAYEIVKEAFESEYGLIWLEPFGFNNTYTLTMRKDQAQALGIETITDLATYISQE